MTTQKTAFSKGFVWGAATAAYQIEGGWNCDGRGSSIWDVLSQEPGRIWENNNGNTACDHYHLWREDIALMRQLGIKAYRFSLSWPRILPEGIGHVNEAGLEFYDRLVDALLEAGIEPWITLYHWDLPQSLYQQGGWLNPKIPQWFAEYTRVVAQRFSDRVGRWMTLNEPQCFIGLGLDKGIHAPCLRLPRKDVLLAAHHALLAHGRAVEVLRESARRETLIGWAPVGVVAIPASEAPADVDAARRAMFTLDGQDAITNPWDRSAVWSNIYWADPVVRGHYPEEAWTRYGTDMPSASDQDLKTISTPLDFYGVNIYHGARLQPATDNEVLRVEPSNGVPRSLFGWERSEEAMYWGTRLLYERYKLPIVIAENGISCHDWVDLEGKVQDPQRIDFTRRYLRQLSRSIQDGTDVKGYFHWSLLDNFEWAEGYKHRFGLIHVDFSTKKRTPKDSYDWYAKVIQSNGANL